MAITDFCKKFEIDPQALTSELKDNKITDLNSMNCPEFVICCIKVFNARKRAQAAQAAPVEMPRQQAPSQVSGEQESRTRGAANLGAVKVEEMEKYKKVAFITSTVDDKANIVNVIQKILFKLYADTRFNDKIKTSVEGRHD